MSQQQNHKHTHALPPDEPGLVAAAPRLAEVVGIAAGVDGAAVEAVVVVARVVAGRWCSQLVAPGLGARLRHIAHSTRRLLEWRGG